MRCANTFTSTFTMSRFYTGGTLGGRFPKMKWKSVSPEAKRRDSPKFKLSNYRNYADYEEDENYNYSGNYNSNSNDRIDSLLMKKIEEMERRERALQRELEFYRLNFGRKEIEGDDINYNNHNNYGDYPNYENHMNRMNQIANITYIDRMNHDDGYFNSNSFNHDEDEDELYFYGGGRKRKTNNNEVDPVREVDPVHEVTVEDEVFNYDPIDFESEESDDDDNYYSDSDVDIKKNTKSKKKPIKSRENIPVTSSLVKPKVYTPKVIDLDAPTLTKLPPNPIPSTWAHIIQNPLKYSSEAGQCEEILTESIVNDETWYFGLKGRKVQGILMRPPLNENFSVLQWAKFMKRLLPNVLDDGYLFVWVEREDLADVIRAAEKHLSFKYVENLCWIQRDLGNRLVKDPGFLFNKSKMTLLILRRDPNNRCKLRHQRNPDCIFDFIGPRRMPDGRVYDVIETLLDGTRLNGPHLMHLWANSSPIDRLVYRSRKQWIRVLEMEVGGDSKVVEELKNKEEEKEEEQDGQIGNTNMSSSEIIQTSIPPPMPPSSTFDEDFCNFIICEHE